MPHTEMVSLCLHETCLTKVSHWTESSSSTYLFIMPEKCFTILECLERGSPMESLPCFYFSFKSWCVITLEVRSLVCTQLTKTHRCLSVSPTLSLPTPSGAPRHHPNFLDHLQTIDNGHIFYPKSLINMASNINLGYGVWNLEKS